MFGAEEATWIKKDILDILDNKNDYVSTTELYNILNQKSHSTIKKICYQLKNDIDEHFTEDQVQLLVNKHYGIKLIKKNTNIHTILNFIFSKDLTYEILTKVFYYRELSTISFCRNHFISESQLRRRIKK